MRAVVRRALAGCGLVLVAWLLVVAPPASAHAVLVSSSPADGTRLDRPPADVRLRFDEDVELVRSGTGVLADTGRSVLSGRARLRGGHEVVLPLPPGLPRGAYTASWRVVSADGHVVTGSVRFGIGVDPVGRPHSRAGPVAPAVLGTVARATTYTGAVLMVGVPLVGLLLWSSTLALPRTRRIQVSGTALLAGGSLLDLLQRGPAATGSGLAGTWRLAGLDLVLHTHDGRLLVARLVVCAVLGTAVAVLSRRPSPRLPGLVVVTWLLVVTSLAWTGHAVVGPLVWLAVGAAVLHVAAMTTWLGGLVLLFAVVLRGPDPDLSRLPEWSRLAMTSVGLVVLSGTVQALRQVHPLGSLWTTGYGLVLLAKLALVAVVIGLAGVARREVLRRDRRASALRASVRLELVVLAGVLAVTGVLVARPPARETYGPALARTLPLPDGSVELTVADTHRGTQPLRVRVLDRRGRVVRLGTVTGRLASPAAGVGGLAVHFVRGQHGVWRSTNAVLPVPGTWTLTVSVQPPGALAYVAATTYRVW